VPTGARRHGRERLVLSEVQAERETKLEFIFPRTKPPTHRMDAALPGVDSARLYTRPIGRAARIKSLSNNLERRGSALAAQTLGGTDAGR